MTTAVSSNKYGGTAYLLRTLLLGLLIVLLGLVLVATLKQHLNLTPETETVDLENLFKVCLKNVLMKPGLVSFVVICLSLAILTILCNHLNMTEDALGASFKDFSQDQKKWDGQALQLLRSNSFNIKKVVDLTDKIKQAVSDIDKKEDMELHKMDALRAQVYDLQEKLAADTNNIIQHVDAQKSMLQHTDSTVTGVKKELAANEQTTAAFRAKIAKSVSDAANKQNQDYAELKKKDSGLHQDMLHVQQMERRRLDHLQVLLTNGLTKATTDLASSFAEKDQTQRKLTIAAVNDLTTAADNAFAAETAKYSQKTDSDGDQLRLLNKDKTTLKEISDYLSPDSKWGKALHTLDVQKGNYPPARREAWSAPIADVSAGRQVLVNYVCLLQTSNSAQIKDVTTDLQGLKDDKAQLDRCSSSYDAAATRLISALNSADGNPADAPSADAASAGAPSAKASEGHDSTPTASNKSN